VIAATRPAENPAPQEDLARRAHYLALLAIAVMPHDPAERKKFFERYGVYAPEGAQ